MSPTAVYEDVAETELEELRDEIGSREVELRETEIYTGDEK